MVRISVSTSLRSETRSLSKQENTCQGRHGFSLKNPRGVCCVSPVGIATALPQHLKYCWTYWVVRAKSKCLGFGCSSILKSGILWGPRYTWMVYLKWNMLSLKSKDKCCALSMWLVVMVKGCYFPFSLEWISQHFPDYWTSRNDQNFLKI